MRPVAAPRPLPRRPLRWNPTPTRLPPRPQERPPREPDRGSAPGPTVSPSTPSPEQPLKGGTRERPTTHREEESSHEAATCPAPDRAPGARPGLRAATAGAGEGAVDRQGEGRNAALRHAQDEQGGHRAAPVLQGGAPGGGQLRGPRHRGAALYGPDHRQEGERPLLPERDLSPGDPGVHDPGRRS